MFTKLRVVAVVCLLMGCNSDPVATKVEVASIKEPIATIDGNVAIDFSPDGRWLAVGAQLVDTNTWKVIAEIEKRISDDNPTSKNHWGYTSVAFSPDSKKLALGDQDGSLRILEVPSMVKSLEFLAHGARLTGIGFANDNETIVTTSVDDSIRMWNSRTGDELVRTNEKQVAGEIKSIADFVGTVDVFALSPDRESFAAADTMNRVLICSMRDGKILHEFKGPGSDKTEIDSLAFTPDSKQLLIAVAPKVYIYDVNGTSTDKAIETNGDSPVFVKSIDQNGMIAMYYNDSATHAPVIEFYDLPKSKSLGKFHPHSTRGNYWATSYDGKYIATINRGGPIRLWSVTNSLQDLSSSNQSTPNGEQAPTE